MEYVELTGPYSDGKKLRLSSGAFAREKVLSRDSASGMDDRRNLSKQETSERKRVGSGCGLKTIENGAPLGGPVLDDARVFTTLSFRNLDTVLK